MGNNRQNLEDNKFYLGLDVGGTNLVAGVVDSSYNIIAKESILTHAREQTVDEAFMDMASVSKKAVATAGLKMEDISSWGIGMPSCINPKTMKLVHSNNFGWKNIPVYDYLKKYIQIPTYVANDANCAAYGEILAGAAKDCTDAIMLTLGTGVGGGIIINKQIYCGHDTMGAELGHTKLVYNGELCTCGQRGCLESYCSSTALIRHTKEKIVTTPDSLIMKLCGDNMDKIDGKVIFDAARRKDELAMQIVDEYISYLAAGLSTFIVIFRPERIILGGGISQAHDLLFPPLNKKLFTSTFGAEEIGVPEVVPAKLGNDAGIIGAAFLEKTM